MRELSGGPARAKRGSNGSSLTQATHACIHFAEANRLTTGPRGRGEWNRSRHVADLQRLCLQTRAHPYARSTSETDRTSKASCRRASPRARGDARASAHLTHPISLQIELATRAQHLTTARGRNRTEPTGVSGASAQPVHDLSALVNPARGAGSCESPSWFGKGYRRRACRASSADSRWLNPIKPLGSVPARRVRSCRRGVRPAGAARRASWPPAATCRSARARGS